PRQLLHVKVFIPCLVSRFAFDALAWHALQQCAQVSGVEKGLPMQVVGDGRRLASWSSGSGALRKIQVYHDLASS
ncbi:MAG: hypothetical protein NZ728_10170, partial [Oleiphilaceae bacterium]|nr:hypothetical protein [Oleiphilaceae bacterium]